LDLDRLKGASCLLIDGFWPDSALQAARRARAEGVPVVADFGGVEGKRKELLPLVDFLITNEECARRVAGRDDPERACRMVQEMGAKVVVATLGDRGCAFAGEGVAGRMPAFEVDVVDTTGAGDCFHGAFCVGVVRGWPLERTLEFASATSALKCRKLGGRAGLPTLDEVNAFLEERGR
jgi:sugar/nucleoside kinase (ribokinase family)